MERMGPAVLRREQPMSEQIKRRLEEVMAMVPCPVSGCWFVHGADDFVLL